MAAELPETAEEENSSESPAGGSSASEQRTSATSTASSNVATRNSSCCWKFKRIGINSGFGAIVICPGRSETVPEQLGCSAVAVLRHAEREDSIWDSAWHGTEDAKLHPADCPITSKGLLEARRMAEKLRQFGDFGIIVASPYLRCVQTAVVIAEELDLVVLLDQELGEVYGPVVFGEASAHKKFPSGRACRSRKELHRALVHWAQQLPSDFSRSPAARVCWKRILGKAPLWGERLPEARLRYARRFLTYLSRSRRAQKNVLMVSHGHMIQTGLKVLPATAADEVASVRYCGGFMARFQSTDPTDLDLEATRSLELTAEGALTHSSSKETLDEQWPESDGADNASCGGSDEDLRQAKVQQWDVRVLGMQFTSRGSCAAGQLRAPSQELYRDFLGQIGSERFSWPHLHALLGQLPSDLPSVAFLSAGGRMADATDFSDSATQSSMDMFAHPCALSFQSSSGTSTQEVEQEPVREGPAQPFNLKMNSLLARRGLGRA